MIRVLRLVEIELGGGYKDFRRKMVFKPHNAGILDLSFSELNPLFATTGGDGTVFFFDIRSNLSVNNQWIPLKFIRILPVSDSSRELPHTTLTTNTNNLIICERLSWKILTENAGNKDIIMCSCSDGILREFDVLTLVQKEEELTATIELPTYETFLPIIERIFRVPLHFCAPVVAVVVAQNTGGGVVKSNSTVLATTTNINSSKDLLGTQV